MLNAIQMTMKTITFATLHEAAEKVLELTRDGKKFKVIGRLKIVIFE